MKEEIKNYFTTDRSHALGVALVIKHSNRLSLKKQVNIHPQSEYMTGIIHEELRELAGLSRDELYELLQKPISKPLPASISEATEVGIAETYSMVPESPLEDIAAEKKVRRKK